MSNIGIIGIGRLGLSFALLCENRGYNVIASDRNEQYIQSLQDKSHKTSEPFIEQFLQDANNIHFTTENRKVVQNSDIIFLFVPTPSLENGEYDHQYIEQVLSEIDDMDLSDKLLIIGCTVMPGYSNTVRRKLRPGIKNLGLMVVYNPEFIAQGSIIHGLETADIVLVGTDSICVPPILKSIYQRLMITPLNMRVMSPTAAEITKISINCFLTMKIAYRNMIGEIAINSGIESEVNTILQAIGDDSRIGTQYLLYYGFGYGGPCLVRDNRALNIHAGIVGVNTKLPSAIDISNDLHAIFLRNYYIQKNPDKNVPFLFTQITYKKGVEIITESQQYRLCKDLLEAGYSINISESPLVIKQVENELSKYGTRVTYEITTNGYKIDI